VRAVGLGSHCDSVRGGGRFDGLLGVLAAIEVARVCRERRIELPLQVVSWLEEEGSGFGRVLLGSRIAAGQIDTPALREEVRALDDGRSFFEHAQEAGLDPRDSAACAAALDGLSAWIELHIEQGRVLEDAGERIGVVEAIAGYFHADVEIEGQADHAGGTPMDLRRDAGVVAAEIMLELERLAVEAGGGAVATVGELALSPGAINIVPGRARMSFDLRAPDAGALGALASAALRRAAELAERRGLAVTHSLRHRVDPVALDPGIIAAVAEAASATGAPWRKMISGPGHDTMSIAPLVPSAMVFVPCRAGISHAPAEYASPDDAALGVEVLLNAAVALAR
jgi:allantoate deiminase